MEFYQPPKEMISDDGHIYQLKKPLYKQGLFWSTVVGGVLVGLLSIGMIILTLVIVVLSDENAQIRKHARGETSSYYTGYDTNSYYDEAAFGKVMTVKKGITVQVQSAKKDPKRSLSDDSSGQAVVVTVTIKNNSNQSVLISPYDFYLYDEEDNIYLIDSTTFDNQQVGTNLAKGKSITMDIIFDGEQADTDNWSVTYNNIRWSKGGKSSRQSGGSAI
ncbi:DUF4352 domain-containing protein [Streptococcus massiliensis]|uniref:ATPase n=1 Tax=Streptococcus massiliensis TaxID=313439 RepID=A0A380L0K7_9STRE|nr:DUF4352 domain-containing protein [Streptococcus massiliensis]SUN77332.1 ATPase [Streptococcus massiliensis]